MVSGHPVQATSRWFAWYRVPVADNKTAWLCWVERTIFWNGVFAYWVYRMPGVGDDILAKLAEKGEVNA